MDIAIAPMSAQDWAAVRAIYLEGIATKNATFETAAPDWERWDEAHLPVCRLVARVAGEVVGWTALSPVSRRPVYAGVADLSIYVSRSARGQGVGSALLSRVIRDAESAGIWTLQAGIFPENTPSLNLHQRAGFRVVGVRERIGSMEGKWRDVVLLERRSPVVD